MPKYAALLYSPAEEEGADVAPEVMQQVMGEYMEFGENARDVLVGGEALHPTATLQRSRSKVVEAGGWSTPMGRSPRPRKCLEALPDRGS